MSFVDFRQIVNGWDGNFDSFGCSFFNQICIKLWAINVICSANILGKQTVCMITPIYYHNMNRMKIGNLSNKVLYARFAALISRYFLILSHFSRIINLSGSDDAEDMQLNGDISVLLSPLLMSVLGFYTIWLDSGNIIWFVNDNCPYGFSNDIEMFMARNEGNKIWHQLKYYFKKWFMIDYLKIKMMRYILFYHSPIEINEYYICDIISYCLNNYNNINNKEDTDQMRRIQHRMILCNSMVITSTQSDFITDNDNNIF